jgi:hypothetical protein
MPPRSSTPRPLRPARKAVRRDGSVVHVHYTPKVAAEICERIANGDSWYRICNTGRLPSYRTLYTWRDRYPEFAEALAQAQEVSAHARFEKALAVAEDATAATVQADRLHVGTLKWHAERLAPAIYGPGRGAGENGERVTTVILQQYRRDPLGGPAIPVFDEAPVLTDETGGLGSGE